LAAIVFLSLSEVLHIHQDQLQRYGGMAGVRDLDLLKSALAMPSASFAGHFLHTTLQEMAAAYLFHLVKNHPFIDGNKRVGAAATLVFLLLNGTEFCASSDNLASFVIALAEGKVGKAEATLFIEKWAQAL
jgi:death-on-curing protein